MVCEPLGTSLYQYIKDNDYKGLPIEYVRDIARFTLFLILLLYIDSKNHVNICESLISDCRQLLEAMMFLERMKLVHTGIKLHY